MAAKRRAAKRVVEDADEFGEAPLFEDDGRIDHIAVERIEPAEGFLGNIEPGATEEDIRGKYGGGKFRLRARDAGSRFVKGVPLATVTIGGDPVFQSNTFEQQWRRRQGLTTTGASNGNGVISEKPLGFGELMLLMDKGAERARATYQEQAQIREREAVAAHERQLEQIRAEAKRREQELAFERERLKTEAAEREGRLAREMAAERERQREHNAAMLQLISEKGKQASEGGAGVQTLIAGMKLAQELTGGGEGGGDPLTAFAQNLPDIIEQGGKLIAMDKASAGQAGKIRANPRSAKVGKDDVVLTGEVAKKAAQLVKHLEAQGKNPARVLSRAFDVIGRTKAAPAPAASSPSSRPAARAAARRPPPRRAPTPAAPKSRAGGKTATPKR
jgi:hypothetical protein